MVSQLQVFLLTASFGLDGMTSHKHGPAAKYSFKIAASKVNIWTSFETNLFRILGTLEAVSLRIRGVCEKILVMH